MGIVIIAGSGLYVVYSETVQGRKKDLYRTYTSKTLRLPKLFNLRESPVRNPTNSSQPETLQVKSHFLVKSTNLVGEIIFLNNYAQIYYTDVVTCG